MLDTKNVQIGHSVEDLILKENDRVVVANGSLRGKKWVQSRGYGWV